MNKVVREHYPAERLPDDLRRELGDVVSVTVTLEEEPPGSSVEDFVTELRRDIAKRKHGVTVEEATARVRALRDEWDD